MAVKKVLLDKANRFYQMPPAILDFVRADRKVRTFKRTETIDLANFVWPVPFDGEQGFQVQSLRAAPPERLTELKMHIADWMVAQHRVKLLPDKEIFIGGSVPDLLYRLAFVFVDYGDISFVPDIATPLYRQVTTAFGGEPVTYATVSDNNWMPSFDRVQTRLGRVARLLFLNSPHNPTGATLGQKELTDLVWMAARENILVVNDATFQGVPERLAPSLLTAEGAKKTGVEVYSVPYIFGLPDIPLGFAVGNREVIRGLKSAADILPHYVPDIFVSLTIQAIRAYPSAILRELRESFRRADGATDELLQKLSLERAGLSGVPFIWAKIERRSNAVTAARVLHRRYRILAAPGTGFGECGQGYLRFSLGGGAEQFRQAADRVKKKVRLLHRVEEDE
jgi:aspartate/methionine/tyrosine aminotransferase